jgi:hypothetical protein
MQIIKKRLKNALNNKIIHNKLTPYNIFYVILDPDQTITTTFRKKVLTKVLFKKNFSLLKNSSFIYPICYLSTENTSDLLLTYSKLKQNTDFKKILICNFKLKFLIFKNINLLNYYHLNNNLLIFYKLYFLLNTLLLNFHIFKNLKMFNK